MVAGNTCPKCDALNVPDAAFCKSCGAALNAHKGSAMNFVKALTLLIVVFVILALIAGGCAISGYNKAIRLNENVDGAWAQVENQLQRRFDLVPNLVETVKGYAAQEKELFENIAQARTKYFNPNATQADKMQSANRLEGFLSRLLVLQERYPDLKANEGFLNLQAQLEGAENRLAVERKRYNDAVRALNTFAKKFLGRIFAGWAGVEPREYFEAAEPAKETPKVEF